jgi:NAD(P)H-dependent FMN reductase
MSKKVKIVALAGATRTDSLNKKLIRVAAAAATAAGAEVTLVDLRDYPMPFYDGDLESASGLPDNAKKLKQLFIDSDGILIASPEYNSSYSAVLKNAIDWMSRSSAKDEASAFNGKYAAILSASPGALGGLRGLFALRELLQNLNITVLPAMQAVGSAMTAFDDKGALTDEKTAAGVNRVAQQLVATLEKIHA